MGFKRNIYLLLVLLALSAIWYVTVYIIDANRKETITDTFPKINPYDITGIKIYAIANNSEETFLYLKGDKWRVLSGTIDAPLQPDRIEIVLEELIKLNATRVAAVSAEQWADLEISDSLATRMVLLTKQGVFLDFLIGKFQYKTPEIKPLNPKVKTETKGITYVRKFGEERVYSAENFFGPNFNQHADVWRNQYILRLNVDALQKIVFIDAQGMGYEVEIKDYQMYIDGKNVPIEFAAEYVGLIRSFKFGVFADGFEPKGEPVLTAIYLVEGMTPVFVKVYEDEMGRTVLNSSQNPETYFYDHDGTLTDQLFLSKTDFGKTK
jgi:hypothetical protein